MNKVIYVNKKGFNLVARALNDLCMPSTMGISTIYTKNGKKQKYIYLINDLSHIEYRCVANSKNRDKLYKNFHKMKCRIKVKRDKNEKS